MPLLDLPVVASTAFDDADLELLHAVTYPSAQTRDTIDPIYQTMRPAMSTIAQPAGNLSQQVDHAAAHRTSDSPHQSLVVIAPPEVKKRRTQLTVREGPVDALLTDYVAGLNNFTLVDSGTLTTRAQFEAAQRHVRAGATLGNHLTTTPATDVTFPRTPRQELECVCEIRRAVVSFPGQVLDAGDTYTALSAKAAMPMTNSAISFMSWFVMVSAVVFFFFFFSFVHMADRLSFFSAGLFERVTTRLPARAGPVRSRHAVV